jgi:hypothetical protein
MIELIKNCQFLTKLRAKRGSSLRFPIVRCPALRLPAAPEPRDGLTAMDGCAARKDVHHCFMPRWAQTLRAGLSAPALQLL